MLFKQKFLQVGREIFIAETNTEIFKKLLYSPDKSALDVLRALEGGSSGLASNPKPPACWPRLETTVCWPMFWATVCC